MSVGLVCVNTNCARAGYAVSRPTCGICGQPTHRVDEPGLVVPSPQTRGSSTVEALENVTDIGSRIMYGGFWSIAALVCVAAGILVLAQGNAVGLLGFGIGGVAALYAGYIFKGGRFRIMFW